MTYEDEASCESLPPCTEGCTAYASWLMCDYSYELYVSYTRMCLLIRIQLRLLLDVLQTQLDSYVTNHRKSVNKVVYDYLFTNTDSCANAFVVLQARLFQAILPWNCRQTARSWFREIECVCVGERETAGWRVCVGARVFMCVCVCVCVLAWATEREKVCVCVFDLVLCVVCGVVWVWVWMWCVTGRGCGCWQMFNSIFAHASRHMPRVYCMCVCMCGYLFCEC